MTRFLFVLALVSAAAAQTALPPLIAEAERNNPRIAAAEQAWRAAEAAVAPAGALPDPQATLQQMSVGSPAPFAGYTTNNFAYLGVGVSQDLPYPGKLQQRAQIAASEAQAQRAALEATRRQVAEQVAAAYVQLAYLQQTLGLLRQQRSLLAEAEQWAEVRYRAGPGSQADVLAAQLAQTELLRDFAIQQQQQAATQAELRALLNRAPGSPPVAAAALAPTHLPASDDQLQAMLPAADPALGGEQARIAGADHAVKLAHLNFRPDFNAQYMFQRTGPNFPAYYQWTVGMTLPFFHRRSRQQPELQQAVAQRLQAQSDYQAELQQERYALTNLLLTAHSDEQILQIDQGGLLTQAEARWSAALAAYRDGRGGLADLLLAGQQELAIEQQYWHTLAEHETALDQITALTGVQHVQ